MTAESEHSAMSACITASLAGVRVFTATASQGLLLMHELLHYASGARAPIVMANVNRTVASPWGFWPDQTDSLAQRDTGWIQFYVESAQEALDTRDPGLPCRRAGAAAGDGHPRRVLRVARAGAGRRARAGRVDAYLPPFAPEHRLDTHKVESWGNVVTQDMFYRHRQASQQAMDRVPQLLPRPIAPGRRASAAARAWSSATAATAPPRSIVTHGQHVRHRARCHRRDARRRACAVGLVKVQAVPAAAGRRRCARRSRASADVVVLDRNLSPGAGGVLHQELRAALYGMADAPRVHG